MLLHCYWRLNTRISKNQYFLLLLGNLGCLVRIGSYNGLWRGRQCVGVVTRSRAYIIHPQVFIHVIVCILYIPSQKSGLDSGCRDPDVWKVLCFVHGFCPPTRQVSLFRSLDLIARSVDELQILGNKAIDLVPLGTVTCWLNGHGPAVTCWLQLIDTYL